MTIRTLLAVLVISAFASRLEAQAPAGAERAPKRPIDLEREAERVRTRDLALERHPLPPLKTRALRKAVEGALAGEPVDGRVTARWGEFLTADGQYFVPLQLACASQLGFAAGQKALAFGALYGANGKEVLSFEVERTLSASGANLYSDLPLPLEPGEYQGVFGLAAGKEPRGLVRLTMSPQPIAKAELTVSRLLLAENLFMLPAAQQPDEPFAFGGIKVVLRGDSRFAAGEQPWAFVVLRQLGMGSEGRPSLKAKLAIEGPDGSGSKSRILPVADPAPTPLKGFPGQWALGFPLDLTREAPGRYEVTIEIEDLNRQEIRRSAASFEVIPR